MLLDLYRGIAVSAADRDCVTTEVLTAGIRHSPQARYDFFLYPLRGRLAELRSKADLNLEDTRAELSDPAVCACGDEEGAAYYALKHNRSSDHPVPLIVKFQAEPNDLCVDGRDFLYTVFQSGYSKPRSQAIERLFGAAAVSYASQAWASDDQIYRIAMCDLACQDTDVILQHHRNPIVIGGRYRTVFKSAFFVKCPVPPARVVRVWSPDYNGNPPVPEVTLDALR
jgi:hypothetical protein